MFLRSLSVFEAGNGGFPLPAHIGTIVLISSEQHREGNECRRWVSDSEMQNYWASGKQAQNQWANGVLAYQGSDPAASGEFRMTVRVSSVSPGGKAAEGRHESLTAEGFKGKRGRGVPKHTDCIMGVFAGVAEWLLMVLLFLAWAGIGVGPSGDHYPSLQCRPLPPVLGNWSPSFDGFI